jgi:hypothetical protein
VFRVLRADGGFVMLTGASVPCAETADGGFVMLTGASVPCAESGWWLCNADWS